MIYLISYVVLFCSVPVVVAVDNDDKGHERSRYNCCDDDGCTKVYQCCKFEMKTNLKLAYEEDLHAVSNQGLTMMIRVYE